MVLKIYAFELVARNSLNSDENTCDRPSTGENTVLRFRISLREIFSNSICLTLIEHYVKGAAVLI